mgnify:CR=1 FL=1
MKKRSTNSKMAKKNGEDNEVEPTPSPTSAAMCWSVSPEHWMEEVMKTSDHIPSMASCKSTGLVSSCRIPSLLAASRTRYRAYPLKTLPSNAAVRSVPSLYTTNRLLVSPSSSSMPPSSPTAILAAPSIGRVSRTSLISSALYISSKGRRFRHQELSLASGLFSYRFGNDDQSLRNVNSLVIGGGNAMDV